MQVEIWSDVVCPWCYLGKRRFETALAGFAHSDKVEVVYRSFELDPSADRATTAPTVELLAKKYGMTSKQAEQAQRQMEQRAEQDGLTFAMAGLRSGNTRDAHRLLHLAKVRGRQVELAERLHRAYFTETRSVFDAESLVDLAADAGLDRAEAQAVLAGTDFDDAVEEDEALARSFGANGVPFFVIDRKYAVSGAQPATVLGDVLEQIWQQTVGEDAVEDEAS
jgi:predicted DsbA family dithiol-disulfide isomerase